MDYYEPRLLCDATQIGRFRTVIGEAGIPAILEATIQTVITSNAIALGYPVKPVEFERITGWPSSLLKFA
jgi:transposase, IS5 family